MTRALILSTILALAITVHGQSQQDTSGLVPGRRIRIHQRNNQKLVGRFVSMDSASLAMVTKPGDTAQVARSTIAGLDLSDGTKSKAGRGALTGLLIGAAVGALAGLGCEGEVAGVCMAGGALVVGALGAGVGALIGSGSRTDKWEPTAWPTLSFQPNGPEGAQIALGMHLRF